MYVSVHPLVAGVQFPTMVEYLNMCCLLHRWKDQRLGPQLEQW